MFLGVPEEVAGERTQRLRPCSFIQPSIFAFMERNREPLSQGVVNGCGSSLCGPAFLL